MARPQQNNEKSVSKVTADRASRTASTWKLLVHERRQCGWRYAYTFRRSSQSYHLRCKEQDHLGHDFREAPAANVTQLLSIKDVTPSMHDMLRKWVDFRCNTQSVRKVSLTHTLLLTFADTFLSTLLSTFLATFPRTLL